MKKLFLIPLIFLSGCDYTNKYNTDDECTKENMAKFIVYGSNHPKSYNKNALDFAKKYLLVDYAQTNLYSKFSGAPLCYLKYKIMDDDKNSHEIYIKYSYEKETFDFIDGCSYKLVHGNREFNCK